MDPSRSANVQQQVKLRLATCGLLSCLILSVSLVWSAAEGAPAPSRKPARPSAPRKPAPHRVMEVLDGIRRNLQTTRYLHTTVINERAGRYDFDCSGMAAWVLRRSAPGALQAVGSRRPLAVDFYRTILRAPTDRYRWGWRRITRIADALPGDVLAWKRPPWFRSSSTGHVAFVVSQPWQPPGWTTSVLVRVADSSKFNHEDDTREGGTGFGVGTLLITTAPGSGEGTAYGWYGSQSEGVIPTRVVIGRVSR